MGSRPIAFYLPQIVAGGAENNFAKIASALVRRGFQVDILVSTRSVSRSPYLDEGVGVVWLRPWFGCFRFFSLASYLRRRRPRVLMCGLEGPILLGCFVKALGLARGTRVVASLRNRDDILIEDYPRGLKRFFFRALYTRLIRSADFHIAVAEALKTGYLVPVAKVPPEKIAVILNPVQPEIIRKKAEEPVVEEWSGRLGPRFILAVGRLELQKDYPTLLRAFALVRERWKNRLLILGEGSERPRLEALVRDLKLQEAVLMPGYCANPYRFMKRAEIFVFPSKHEGLGNVLLEAMVCGVPIVSTDCPTGPWELLEGGKWGRLVPVGDVRALADAVLGTLAGGRRPDYEKRLLDFDFNETVGKYAEALGLAGKQGES